MKENINISIDNLSSYLNAIENLKYREVPYMSEKEIFTLNIYTFDIPKKYNYIFSIILKLIPLYYETGEYNNIIVYNVNIPIDIYFNSTKDFLYNFRDYLWNLRG